MRRAKALRQQSQASQGLAGFNRSHARRFAPNHTVPLYVTNNPALARAYAAVLALWLEDARATEAPLTIVELGAGSGRFTFLLLRQLELLLGQQPPVPFRYVATDFARQNIDFCREHPQLQSFRERGWLDFAVFDTEGDSSLTLLDSGTTIQAGDLHAPLLVIANYVFDGLRNDAFRMQDGTLSELRLTLGSEQPRWGRWKPRTTQSSLFTTRLEARAVSAGMAGICSTATENDSGTRRFCFRTGLWTVWTGYAASPPAA